MIGLVLNATNLHYCLSRDRMKFGIMGPKDRFVQDICVSKKLSTIGVKAPPSKRPRTGKSQRLERAAV